VAGEQLRWETCSHHYKATHFSGYMTGLGLWQLCSTPSARLKNHCWTASHTTIHTDLTKHHLISFLLLTFILYFLANQQSCCDSSLLTLLATKPPRSTKAYFRTVRTINHLDLVISGIFIDKLYNSGPREWTK
jgi:hypothetical protein